jgi:uncharacterized protein (DUF488 family)
MERQRDRNIFTIGHSVHELEDFIGLLARHQISALADVRSQPFSRIEHFNGPVIAAVLKARGIKYVPLGRELGARRDEQECYVDGQAVYERIAQLPKFQEGIDRLIRGASEHRIALMCAEKEPLDCHRTVLVCRNLRPHGLQIQHILANGELENHADSEKRMMKMMGIGPDLFQLDVAESELIEQAYEARGRQIAYTVVPEAVTT